MRTLMLIFIACALVGCQSGRQQAQSAPLQFDPPRAGQIQVALSGDVKSSGKFWIAEPATLASIEAVAGPGTPAPAPRDVMITRRENGNSSNTVLVVGKMSQAEKEAVVLEHGDVVRFFTPEQGMFPY